MRSRLKTFLGMFLLAGSAVAEHPASWTEPVDPFRIIGNVYYVGTADLASYLITTPEGHILLDAPMEENVPHLLRSIRALGFDPAEIEVMINSHAHFDHAGGFARMKEVTVARLLVSAPDAALIERGGRGALSLGEDTIFPPAKVDGVVHDGQVVTLGGVGLQAVSTPGHTPGGTSWLMELEEGGRVYRILFANSMSAVYPLVGNADYPNLLSDLRASFDRLAEIQADIFLSTHGSFFRLRQKRETWSGEGNPFVDSEESKRFIDRWRGIVESQYAEQKAVAAVGSVLDRFHEAAARADAETYFSLFAPDAVFIGTDATERWSVTEFREFAKPYFDRGKGWTYLPTSRHVELDPDGNTAWFDEMLENDAYGTTRGTGVLMKVDGDWKIAQYHLTIPIPNEIAKDVVKMIRR